MTSTNIQWLILFKRGMSSSQYVRYSFGVIAAINSNFNSVSGAFINLQLYSKSQKNADPQLSSLEDIHTKTKPILQSPE